MKIDNSKYGKLADDADEIDRGLLKAERKIKRDKIKKKQKTYGTPSQ